MQRTRTSWKAPSTTIEEHFQDYANSPFVQEKFFEDWSHDSDWGWQQNRAVVGHNLKIAWNLMRMQSLRGKDKYVDFARKIAAIMPAVGSDQQRGGWYDMVERGTADGRRRTTSSGTIARPGGSRSRPSSPT